MKTLQQIINDQVDPKDVKIAELQGIVDYLWEGPLTLYEWDKMGYRGHAPDLTGYVETFRDDFNVMSVTPEAGAGPWYSPVHTDFGDVHFRPPGFAPLDPFSIVPNGEGGNCLRVRMEIYQWKQGTRIFPGATKPADPTPIMNASGVQTGWLFMGQTYPLSPKPVASASWQSGHIQTMRRSGKGFSQAMGYFEWRIKFPSGGGTNGQSGYWGGPWNLSAVEYSAGAEYTAGHIGDHMTEMDIMEIYGGDAKGHHATVHVKNRLVPQPGDWPSRVMKSNYTTLSTAKYTQNPTVLMYPGTTWNPMNDQWHLFSAMYDEDWWTIYYDNLSIARFPMLDYWRTPQYLNFSSIIYAGLKATAVSPMDVFIDHVRVLQKP